MPLIQPSWVHARHWPLNLRTEAAKVSPTPGLRQHMWRSGRQLQGADHHSPKEGAGISSESIVDRKGAMGYCAVSGTRGILEHWAEIVYAA